MSSELDALKLLRQLTPSRVRLGSNQGVANTQQVLDLQMAHAQAKDAILLPLQSELLKRSLAEREIVEVRSRACDRSEYLRRPDLGRCLDLQTLPDQLEGPFDVVFVIGDGLSATAVERHAAPVLSAAIQQLDGWSVAPIFIATQARVALADDIGERLNALFTVMMIGERPGLTVSDSMGLYLTFAPRKGTPDSSRNCISNIHGNGGLLHQAAADKLVWLMQQAKRLGCTGIALKDDMPSTLLDQNVELLPRKDFE